jgi:hypothetical protein
MGSVLVAFCFASILATFPLLARASVFGEETAVLSAILKQDMAIFAKSIQTVTQLVQSVQRLKNLVERADRMLAQADPTSLQGVRRLISDTTSMHRAIESDIKYVGYQYDKISSQADKLYRNDYRGMPPEQLRQQGRQWNGALLESAKVAMRTQGNIESLQARATAQADLLTDSQSTEGVVGQLQIVVRNLALIHRDLEAIGRTLDTGLRVTASMAAKESSGEALMKEELRTSMDGYTDPGPAVAIPNNLD